MLNVGDKAPDFSLTETSGATVSLKELRGKRIVLYFYPKDLTSGCTQQACDIRDNIKRFQKKGVEVIGVSADPPRRHKKFIAEHDLNFQLLSDESKQMLHAYGVWQEKTFWGRKYMGIVRTTFVINEKGVIEKIYHVTNVEGHIEEVLENL